MDEQYRPLHSQRDQDQVLDDQGFRADFVLRGRSIHCPDCDRTAPPEDWRLLKLRRTEGATDPDEMLYIAGLECPGCQTKGTVTFNYGPGASPEHHDVFSRLKDERHEVATASASHPDQAQPSAV